LRREIAESESVPSYIVFNDASLVQMVRDRPKTKTDFLAITGVGPTKLERYGKKFLGLINQSKVRSRDSSMQQQSEISKVKVQGVQKEIMKLANQGKDLGDISNSVGLLRPVVVGYLEKLIDQGVIMDISPWLDASTLGRVRNAASGRPISSLSPLHKTLGKRVSFEQLQIARAWLNQEGAIQ
jgi:ATP-dependent DNA helicase RecQ